MTTTNAAVEVTEGLLSCPFCKSATIIIHDQDGIAWSECQNCNAEGPPENTAAEAIAAWNKRAHTQPAEIAGRDVLPTDHYGETAYDRLKDHADNGVMPERFRDDLHAILAIAADAILKLRLAPEGANDHWCPTCGKASPDGLDCLACARWWAAQDLPDDAWMPIETAPKDGTPFLGGCWHEDGSGKGPRVWRQSVMWWDAYFATGDWDEAVDDVTYIGAWCAGRVGSFQYEEYAEEHPEFWRPLPPAPSAPDREAE